MLSLYLSFILPPPQPVTLTPHPHTPPQPVTAHRQVCEEWSPTKPLDQAPLCTGKAQDILCKAMTSRLARPAQRVAGQHHSLLTEQSNGLTCLQLEGGWVGHVPTGWQPTLEGQHLGITRTGTTVLTSVGYTAMSATNFLVSIIFSAQQLEECFLFLLLGCVLDVFCAGQTHNALSETELQMSVMDVSSNAVLLHCFLFSL